MKISIPKSRIVQISISFIVGGLFGFILSIHLQDNDNPAVRQFWETHNMIYGPRANQLSTSQDLNDIKNNYDKEKSKLLLSGELFEKIYTLDEPMNLSDFLVQQVIYFQNLYKPGIISGSLENGEYNVFDDVDNLHITPAIK